MAAEISEVKRMLVDESKPPEVIAQEREDAYRKMTAVQKVSLLTQLQPPEPSRRSRAVPYPCLPAKVFVQ
jgi:hypothetical protein